MPGHKNKGSKTKTHKSRPKITLEELKRENAEGAQRIKNLQKEVNELMANATKNMTQAEKDKFFDDMEKEMMQDPRLNDFSDDYTLDDII